jgi:diguanylate cyclase (GGDEF)-like protein/PAS domain S-box-containing protein
MRLRLPFPLEAASALTLAAGVIATAALYVAVSRLEDEKMRMRFEQRAGIRIAAIRQGLDEAVDVLTVTNNLFAAVEPVTRQQFHDFTAPLLRRYPFIKAFNFHRQLVDAERAGFEAQLGRIVAASVITEMADGTIRPAPRRPRYNVVEFIEPMAGNEVAFGLDVGNNAHVTATLARAVGSGRPSATALLDLIQDPRPQAGLLVMLPVYRPRAALGSTAERSAALIGDTAAIIRAGDLVQDILSDNSMLADPDILLAVYAAGADGQPRLLFRSGANLSRLPQQLPQPLPLPQLSRSIDVAGQPWRIDVAAAPRPYVGEHVSSLLVLVGGALLTFLMSVLVQAMVQRARRVERLVLERTADLQLSNHRLSEDVLERRRTEKALQRSEQRFRQLVSMSSDWYWEQDAQFRFVSISGGFGDEAQAASRRYIGRTRWEVSPSLAETESGQAHIALVGAHQRFANFEYQTVDGDGGTRWYSVTGEPVFNEHAEFSGYRGTSTDISARKMSEQRIHHVAQHDVLTGLPNRSLLQDRLGQAIAYSTRCSHPVWVMLVDLDRFKFVNDSMGHKAGDVLLVTVAARLRSALRDTDTVARLSGDEFVVILTEHEDQKLSVDVVQRLMDSVAQPVMLGSKEFFVTCSIGVAVYPTDGAPADSLIEHADIAMYRAKKLGRNNFQFYTPAMNEEAMERVRIESALRNALERDEFVLHYQPQVDLASGEIVGMEALIRWQHPEMGMVAPSRFIGVAEETGLIVQIGAWVMRAACQQNRAWHEAGLGKLRVAVNLSARQFGAVNLVADIRSVLAETGLAPGYLEIELTESLFMSDVTLAVELLHAMKALGVKLSIDDFGTGYSSLSYLSRFPIDVLKIDRSFVAAITRDSNDAAIVASIIALAHNLKLSVIAEGVETEEQLDYLRGHGCDQMQGYFFSPPLPATEFEQLLRQQSRLPLLAALAEDALA